jgi:minor histocompatibility antigen H13
MYYLIQWLKDPEILNKILRWYMSVMSLFSVLTLYAHGIDVAVSFVFPHYWRARDGSLRAVDQKARLVRVCDDAGNPIDGREASPNPCPGPLSLLVCTEKIQKAAWDLRELLVKDWRLKFYVRGMGEEKANIRFSHAVALAMAAVTTVAYFTTNSTLLSNMLGYGMCYGSFLLISPTDLMIGSLVLGGLFFYDIFMVFYT